MPMTALGSFRIDSGHPSLAGHFPGNPVVPGAVLLDHACALFAGANPGCRVVGIPRVKFLRPVRPDQTVAVWAESSSDDSLRLRFRCVVPGDAVAEGVLTAADTAC